MAPSEPLVHLSPELDARLAEEIRDMASLPLYGATSEAQHQQSVGRIEALRWVRRLGRLELDEDRPSPPPFKLNPIDANCEHVWGDTFRKGGSVALPMVHECCHCRGQKLAHVCGALHFSAVHGDACPACESEGDRHGVLTVQEPRPNVGPSEVSVSPQGRDVEPVSEKVDPSAPTENRMLTALLEQRWKPAQAALQRLLPSIPYGTDWHAHRYDTDDSMKLILWRGEETLEYSCAKEPK